MEYTQEKKRWTDGRSVDRSSVQEGSGAEIFLVEKEEFKYSIKFKFPVTNNVAEYEALLLGLRLAKKIRAEITLFTNS